MNRLVFPLHEDPFEEIEGSIEISKKGHLPILSMLDNDSEEQEDFFLLLLD